MIQRGDAFSTYLLVQMHLQGPELRSANKQIGTCDDFRRSYSLQGDMQVCDLDRHSLKGPGVDATYHVPSAEDLVSSCEFNMHSQLVFHSTAMCYPVFLPSKAESNLSSCSCCEAVLTLFPCYVVSFHVPAFVRQLAFTVPAWPCGLT